MTYKTQPLVGMLNHFQEKVKFKNKVVFFLKCKIIDLYDNFRMRELCYRMKHCNYGITIDSYEALSDQVGDSTANRIFESMIEECYEDPRRYGHSLDREGGNWLFTHHRYFCNDHILVEFEVQDGNWNGTDIQSFEVTYED
ncbi:conserved hypothetical protein [Vibrio phage 249E41-1]|nr:conserved hypothetical protein [Vibrio phage 249E41-1]CAH9017533.1 conserved hypothetical protein [Vibrio phage 193E37-1]